MSQSNVSLALNWQPVAGIDPEDRFPQGVAPSFVHSGVGSSTRLDTTLTSVSREMAERAAGRRPRAG